MIDLLEGVGQHENSNGNKEKTTGEGDDPHISFQLFKSPQERIEGQRRKKKWESQPHGIEEEKHDPRIKALSGTGIDENGREDRSDTRCPAGCKYDPDKEAIPAFVDFILKCIWVPLITYCET